MTATGRIKCEVNLYMKPKYEVFFQKVQLPSVITITKNSDKTKTTFLFKKINK